MARGPDGTPYAGAELEEGWEGLSAEQLGFVRGLEGIIDGALARHRAGEPFAHGIHQELEPAMIPLLTARYTRAGWASASVRELETGGFMLVLRP